MESDQCSFLGGLLTFGFNKGQVCFFPAELSIHRNVNPKLTAPQTKLFCFRKMTFTELPFQPRYHNSNLFIFGMFFFSAVIREKFGGRVPQFFWQPRSERNESRGFRTKTHQGPKKVGIWHKTVSASKTISSYRRLSILRLRNSCGQCYKTFTGLYLQVCKYKSVNTSL